MTQFFLRTQPVAERVAPAVATPKHASRTKCCDDAKGDQQRLPVRATLPAVPLSELPIMKALMGLPALSKPGARKRIRGEDPKAALATLLPTIVNKLQILALRRPRALIIVAEVLDGLLKRQLDVLDDYHPDRGGTKPRNRAPTLEQLHQRIAKRP